MVFGIDPIYIMLCSVLSMAFGLAAFGYLLFQMHQTLKRIEKNTGLIGSDPHLKAITPAKQGPTAREIMQSLSAVDPIKNPLQVQHLSKMLNEEMLRLQRSAGEPTVAVPTSALQAAMQEGIGRPIA